MRQPVLVGYGSLRLAKIRSHPRTVAWQFANVLELAEEALDQITRAVEVGSKLAMQRYP